MTDDTDRDDGDDGEAAEAALIGRDRDAQAAGARQGLPALFPCPECGGQLWQMDQGALTRFRCHAGHAMTAGDVLRSQFDTVEASLWVAARTMSDKSVLLRQGAARARERGREAEAARNEAQAREAEAHGRRLQELISLLVREDSAWLVRSQEIGDREGGHGDGP